MLVTPGLRRPGQVYRELKASLGCIVSSCLRAECSETPLYNLSIWETGLLETLFQKKERGSPAGDYSQGQRQLQKAGNGECSSVVGSPNTGQLGLVTS